MIVWLVCQFSMCILGQSTNMLTVPQGSPTCVSSVQMEVSSEIVFLFGSAETEVPFPDFRDCRIACPVTCCLLIFTVRKLNAQTFSSHSVPRVRKGIPTFGNSSNQMGNFSISNFVHFFCVTFAILSDMFTGSKDQDGLSFQGPSLATIVFSLLHNLNLLTFFFLG